MALSKLIGWEMWQNELVPWLEYTGHAFLSPLNQLLSTMAAATAQQSLEVFTVGTKAWFTDEKEGWVSATLSSKSVDGDKIKLLFRDDNDDKVGLVMNGTCEVADA